MKATNPYLRREEDTEAEGTGQSDMAAAEVTWLDGNKNEVIPRENAATPRGFANSPVTFMGLGSAASSSLPSSAPDTPMAARRAAHRLRHPSQSPAVDEPEQLKYRTPPSTPFQPGFYRTPQDKLDERKYRLPSQTQARQAARQTQQSSTPSNVEIKLKKATG